ncbi:unnamed protein product [Prunus armeniaca]
MADLNPRLGEMAAENGAFLRSAMEGSRDLSLDQAAREANCHGLVIVGCGLELLVLDDEHHELTVQHDDTDGSTHGCALHGPKG